MKIKLKRAPLILALIILINYVWAFNYFSGKNVVIASSAVNKKVYPIGRTIGLKLYTNGVLVVGMSEIEGKDGQMHKPYENTGIKEGDLIKIVNGKELKNVSELTNILNNSLGEEISIKYERDGNEIYTTVKPIKTIDGTFMIGLWVRDAAAGIGTLTYYDEEENRFSAVGHGIEDVDTGELLKISNGEIVTSKIISIIKGQKNKPGEIRGTLDEGIKIGDVEQNTDIGLYGKVTNIDYINSVKQEQIPVAQRNQIQIGKAKIICQLSNEEVGEYEIEIKKIYKSNYTDNKSMLIRVTDERLIEKTGGIIPGMSGTPIIQNNMLVGAITNVLVTDPTQGFAIFSDMIINK